VRAAAVRTDVHASAFERARADGAQITETRKLDESSQPKMIGSVPCNIILGTGR